MQRRRVEEILDGSLDARRTKRVPKIAIFDICEVVDKQRLNRTEMCSYPTCSYVLLLIAIIPIHHPLLTCKEGTYYVLCTTLILYTTYRWLRKTQGPLAPASPLPSICAAQAAERDVGLVTGAVRL